MKSKKAFQWGSLLMMVALTGFVACQKVDNGTDPNTLTENTLKGASQAYTSETFDEVMEIGDETMSLYERLLFGNDSDGHDGSMGNNGHMGHNGHHGMGNGYGYDNGNGNGHGFGHLDSLWHRGDSLRVDHLDHMGDSLGMGMGRRHLRLSGCATVTRDLSADSLVITINFGADSCISPDGKFRQGKIIMSTIGDYWSGPAEIHFKLENFFVDGNQVTGTSTVNSDINADGNRESQIVEAGSVILADGSGTITWNSQKTRIVTEEAESMGRMDEVISVTGTSSGTLVSGNTFTSQTQSPLVKYHSPECSGVYVSGITKISVSDGTEIFVDYGDGTCDYLATVTTDGVSETITLGKRHK